MLARSSSVKSNNMGMDEKYSEECTIASTDLEFHLRFPSPSDCFLPPILFLGKLLQRPPPLVFVAESLPR